MQLAEKNSPKAHHVYMFIFLSFFHSFFTSCSYQSKVPIIMIQKTTSVPLTELHAFVDFN